jgi:hypothetical protein
VTLLVTPETAKDWLQTRNTKNRPFIESDWMALGLDMIEGRWKPNGDTICFGWNGVLIDGQNRLRACAESGVTIEFDVVFGLDPDCMPTKDIGKVRTAAHIAAMEGIPNSSASAALGALLLIHRDHGIQKLNHPKVKPTKTKVLSFLKENPKISAIAGKTIATKALVAPRIGLFCYYLFSEQDEAKTESFFEQLSGRSDVHVGTPAHRLRERLIANGKAKAKLPPLEIIALVFKAWVAFRDGRQVQNLRWRTAGPTAEEFPTI